MDELSSRLDMPEDKILSEWQNMGNNTYRVTPFMEIQKEVLVNLTV